METKTKSTRMCRYREATILGCHTTLVFPQHFVDALIERTNSTVSLDDIVSAIPKAHIVFPCHLVKATHSGKVVHLLLFLYGKHYIVVLGQDIQLGTYDAFKTIFPARNEWLQLDKFPLSNYHWRQLKELAV